MYHPIFVTVLASRRLQVGGHALLLPDAESGSRLLGRASIPNIASANAQ